MSPAGPYPLVIEDPHDHPNWIELEHQGSGTPGFLKVEYETNTGEIRVAGPIIQGERFIHPAP